VYGRLVLEVQGKAPDQRFEVVKVGGVTKANRDRQAG